jgi:hypothetical protein
LGKRRVKVAESLSEKYNQGTAEPDLENSNSETFLVSTIDQIRNIPSKEAWAEELNNILEKLREAEIEKLYDVSEHIRVIIAGAKSKYLAEQTFWAAFDELLERWQPLTPAPPERLYYILSLISGFTPKAGFVKLAGYLKHNQFFGTYATPMGWEINFQLLALSALEKYYPVAPPSALHDLAYQTYLDILKENLKSPDYFGACATRLIDLKELSCNSPEVLAGISHRQGLDEVINWIFANLTPESVAENLGHLYIHCKNNDLLDYLEASLEPFGELQENPLAQVEHPEGRTDQHRYPSVFLFRRNNATLEISLSESDTREIYEQTDLDMLKLESLIKELNHASKQTLKELKKEISEELSAIIEKSLISTQYQMEDVKRALKKFGGDLLTDESGFSFSLRGEPIAPLNIISKSEVYFELQKNKGSKDDFLKLTRQEIH